MGVAVGALVHSCSLPNLSPLPSLQRACSSSSFKMPSNWEEGLLQRVAELENVGPSRPICDLYKVSQGPGRLATLTASVAAVKQREPVKRYSAIPCLRSILLNHATTTRKVTNSIRCSNPRLCSPCLLPPPLNNGCTNASETVFS